MSDSFGRRTVAGAVFVLLVTGLAYLGGVAFLFLALAVVIAGLLEFYRLARCWGISPFQKTGAVLGSAVVLSAFQWGTAGIVGVSAVSTGACLAVPLMMRSKSSLENGAGTAFGILYVAFLGSFMVALREGPGLAGLPRALGFPAVMGAFLSTWCCDTAAYLFGRAFGRHKLFPAVSPKKTWEGAGAGLVGAVGGLALTLWVLDGSMGWGGLVGVGLALGVAAQVGDLVESRFKRQAGIKDSSRVIPGHGGVLDRFDGFLFVAPVLYYYLASTGFSVLQ